MIARRKAGEKGDVPAPERDFRGGRGRREDGAHSVPVAKNVDSLARTSKAWTLPLARNRAWFPAEEKPEGIWRSCTSFALLLPNVARLVTAGQAGVGTRAFGSIFAMQDKARQGETIE